MSIYIDHNNRTVGPFTLEEINAKLAEGELTAATMAWFAGNTEWVPLSRVPGVNGSEVPPPHAFSGSGEAPTQATTSSESVDLSGSASEPGSTQASAGAIDPQQLFYGQVVQAFELATSHLMQPFEQLDDVVRAKQALDPTTFFRLFLTHAAKFNNDCATAFATVLRQSTRLDAVRATTVKQLAKEIRAEAVEGCDEALTDYHHTINTLMGGVEAAIEQADNMDTPISPTGGALLGSLVAGRGSRVAGAAVGGLTALAGAMSTLNRQLALHGQALELIERAEKAAPAQVAAYLDAVAGMPEALVDLLGAKCFGATVDMQVQQQCVRTCIEHAKGLNARATESVRAMYRHIERLAAAAQAQENRAVRAAQREAESKLAMRRRITFWILFPVWLGLAFLLMDGEYTGQSLFMGLFVSGIFAAILSYSLMRFLRSVGL